MKKKNKWYNDGAYLNTPVVFKVSEHLKNEIDAVAKRNGYHVSELIREIIMLNLKSFPLDRLSKDERSAIEQAVKNGYYRSLYLPLKRILELYIEETYIGEDVELALMVQDAQIVLKDFPQLKKVLGLIHDGIAYRNWSWYYNLSEKEKSKHSPPDQPPIAIFR